MRNLRAINYFGSKVLSAHRYPAPESDLIVEPFAGGAGYSLRHWQKSVVLIDRNPDVIDAWQYLIETPGDVVRQLPLLDPDQCVDDLRCSPGARRLISWCLDQTASPRKYLSSWALINNAKGNACYWGPARREQAAMIADRVKHWMAICGDYRDCPDADATWFIDPPYVDGGQAYPCRDIDYAHLGEWCKSRRGQVIVCERVGADWLPFRPLYEAPTARRYLEGARKRCEEAVWP